MTSRVRGESEEKERAHPAEVFLLFRLGACVTTRSPRVSWSPVVEPVNLVGEVKMVSDLFYNPLHPRSLLNRGLEIHTQGV